MHRNAPAERVDGNSLASGARRTKERTTLLTVDELAARLRVPRSWIYEQTRQRAIPHLRPGKRLLFDEAQVVAWFLETFSRGPLPNRALERRPARSAGMTRGFARRRAGVAVLLPKERS